MWLLQAETVISININLAKTLHVNYPLRGLKGGGLRMID